MGVVHSAGSVARRAAFGVLGESGYERLRARHLARKIRSGTYDVPEIALLGRIVREGETVVDVGANYGLYTFHLARLVGAGGSVIAFEAAPRTAVALRRILTELGMDRRTELVEMAAGDAGGTLRLAIPRRADGSTDSGLAWSVPDGSDVAATEVVDVPVVRLDDALRDAGEISFVKIDVEGADLQVLRGAETILARDVPTILIEVSPRLLARQGLRTDDVGAFFDRHGYATYRFDQHTETLRPWPAREAEGDLLAVHPRRTDRVRALLAG